MARSYKHTPIFGSVANRRTSEKKDKRMANRKLRRINHVQEAYGEYANFMAMREASDIWSFAKDGKFYYKNDFGTPNMRK